MGNKVQVIFTFELKDHTEKSARGGVNAMSLSMLTFKAVEWMCLRKMTVHTSFMRIF